MLLWQTRKSTYVLIKSSKSFSQPGAYVCSFPMATAMAYIIRPKPGTIRFSAYGYVFIHVNVSHLIWTGPPIGPSS